MELNFQNDLRHEAFAVDAFKYLDHMECGKYDLIVLDPPAFAKHKDALRNALKGYTRLMPLLLRRFRRVESCLLSVARRP